MSNIAVQLSTYAQQKRLSVQTLLRWQAWSESDQIALLSIVQELQLGENHLRDFLDWCEEIQLRDGGTIAAVLSCSELRQPLESKLGRNDKLKVVKEALRRIRYPRLSQLEEELKAAIRALDLGSRVQVSFPPSLEGDEFTFVFKARNVAELRESLARLQQRIDEGIMQRVFALLDEV